MMRHSILKSIIVAVLLSVAQMTVAAEDIYIEETSNGQISYAVNGSTVTLAVTPSADYYITVDDIVVQKTIDGGSVASQRASGPKVASSLPLTPVDVDDTGKGTYTFTLVEGYGAYVTATFTECLSVSPSVEISNWIYGETPVAPVIQGNTSSGDVTCYYKDVREEDYSPSVPVNAGEYRLYAVIAAKGHYKSGKTPEIPFSIDKAPLTITAKDYTIKQGEELPTFEITYDGFKNGETSEVLTQQPTVSTNATSSSTPGEYEITVSGADAQNYEITYVAGKLTIVDADALIIKANSYMIGYGDDLPTFEFTSEGAVLEGTPTITCEATKTSPIGTYPIVIAKGSVTNYNATYVNGTLTITKAPLTITAKDYTIKQGEELPTFEVEYEGFKNGETSEVLPKQPTVSTNATSSSVPGEYEITVSGADAQNYEITYVAGKLTIEEKVEIMPITETEETSFKEIIAGEMNLENTVIDNTYYNMDATNGDGYDTTEEALVLNSTTTDEQMNAIQDAEVGDAVVHENYTGIIFEIPESKGSVTVDVQTIGTHVLMVQIGNSVPTKITKMERGTVDVPFDVKEPSYVYLYASTENGSAARLDRAPVVGENSVLLYGYKVTFGASYIPGDANGDGKVNVTDIVEIVSYIMGKPSNRFVFTAADVTGDGDVNVTDIVSVVNIILSNPSREIDEISL